MEDFKIRVVAEKIELDEKLKKLNDFIWGNPVFDTLPTLEQLRLKRQWMAMDEYSTVLGERIDAFSNYAE